MTTLPYILSDMYTMCHLVHVTLLDDIHVLDVCGWSADVGTYTRHGVAAGVGLLLLKLLLADLLCNERQCAVLAVRLS